MALTGCPPSSTCLPTSKDPPKRPSAKPLSLVSAKSLEGHAVAQLVDFFSVERGSPMRAGWNNTADVSVQARDSANSLPMLDIPGLLDSHRLPKAVPVNRALKNIARVSAD